MIQVVFGGILLGFGLLALPIGAPLLVWLQVGAGLALLLHGGWRHLGEIRERLAEQAAQRGAWFGGHAFLQTTALVGLLAALAYLSHRYPLHWDWTEARIHTLAEGSRRVLEQIPEDLEVEVYAFYSDPAPAHELLDLYAYASDRFSYRIVDANQRPLLAQQLEVSSDGVMVVCAGPCESASATARTQARSEQALTEAIRSVISTKRKLYFVIGHDESEPTRQDADGLSEIARRVRGENVETETLLLARQDAIPEDASALVIAAPSFSFFERERQLLDAYLRSGGRVLILADALQEAKLDALLASYSIRLGDDVLLDAQQQLVGPPVLNVLPVVSDYADHPITKPMEGRLTVFRLARSVAPIEGAGDEVTVLLRTSPRSWAVPDEGVSLGSEIELDPERHRKGPFPLAVARRFPPPATAPDGREGRLIVVGDADFARNRSYAEGANADLFLNMVSWLVGEEDFITIDRKLPRASRVELTPIEYRLFRDLGVWLVPEGILLLGVWTWWRRRSA